MGEDRQPEREPERVYSPADVARRLEISPQALRRLAAGYERVYGDLPRDERGRVWPEPAVDRLEAARNVVRAGQYVSVEQALRASEGSEGVEAPPVPSRPAADDFAALVEELRAMRGAIERMSDRLEALERENRELQEAPEPEQRKEPPESAGGSSTATVRPWWRRIFGG